MDISAIASASSALSSAQTGDAVRVSVLKKAINNEGAGALALLQAIPAPVNPLHLGQNIDVFA